jgi:hypothetical protein
VISAFSIGKKQSEVLRFKRAASFNIKIITLPSSVWLLPWSLLGPACQIYGGLLLRIGTAGVLHLDVHKVKTATF